MSTALPPKATPLSDDDVELYATQIVMPEIGPAGQSRLLSSSVLVIGSGEGARTAARYLRGSGIRVTEARDAGEGEVLGPRLTPAFDCVLLADVNAASRSQRERVERVAAPVIWYRTNGTMIESGIAATIDAIPVPQFESMPDSRATLLAAILDRAAGADAATTVVAFLLGWSGEGARFSIDLG